MIDRTNAERQARFRAKRDKELAKLRALHSKEPAKAGIAVQKHFPSGRIEDIACMLLGTFPDDKGKQIASLWLELIAKKGATSPSVIVEKLVAEKGATGPTTELITGTGATSPPVIVEWCTPTQAKHRAEGAIAHLPGGRGWWFALIRWLHGHEHRVIEIIVAPFVSNSPLDAAEKMLAALPGVYRIARFDREGRFGRERGEQRKQVRALMAVTERALQQQPLGRGGWASPGDVVVYDPRNANKPVT
jgi:hypothetical protein